MSDNETLIKKDYSISMLAANIYAIVLAVPFLLGFMALYQWFWGWEYAAGLFVNLLDNSDAFLRADLLFLIIFIVGIPLHEIIHGITWAIAAKKPWSSISFGFQLKTLTPYCHLKEPVNVTSYRWGTVMPGIITGFIPAVLSLMTGNPLLLGIGLLFIFAAGGDLTILWILRNVKPLVNVEDHPTRAGCFVYETD